MDFGLGVVRLPVGETLWGRRIDPARMRLLSVPLPDSGFRCGDIVLHDGEPRGTRVAHGFDHSVFDVIERWEASTMPTVEVVIEADESIVSQLISVLDDAGVAAENWTSSVQVLCLACSQGRVDFDDPDHQHGPALPSGSARIGCSGDPAEVERILRSWTGVDAGSVLSIAEVA